MKTPEQLCHQHGIDLTALERLNQNSRDAIISGRIPERDARVFLQARADAHKRQQQRAKR